MRTGRRFGVAALAAATLLGATATTGMAASHREAPLILNSPQYDNTDTYAFVSPDKPDTVTMIANWSPIDEPSGGPNFYPFSNDARHNIHIDNNHDAVADITYRWEFDTTVRDPKSFLYNTGVVDKLDDPDLNIFQTYDLTKVVGTQETLLLDNAPVAPSFVGGASMPNYAALRSGALAKFGTGSVSFAGQADDPFFLDLRVFDLLYGTNLSEVGNDTLTFYNVNSIALQVPKSELALAGNAGTNPIVGMWSDTEVPGVSTRAADGTVAVSGDFVHVSRLGMPLVNEVVIDLARKDLFNASVPKDDERFLERVTSPLLPKLIESIYKIKAPPEPRQDLVAVFLTGVEGLNKPANVEPAEMIRLNMSIAAAASPNRLGVLAKDNAGFPNGRRLSDDVVDIALQVVMGELVGSPSDLGDGVNENDVAFEKAFPYVALPHSGSSIVPRATRAAVPPAPAPAPAPVGGAAAGTGMGATPRGGVQTGGGGTAPESSPVIPAALMLGGIGMALAAFRPWRLRARGAAPDAH